MAVLGEIRKRPAILVGFIALGLLAFVVNPNSIEKVFGKNPDVLGKVNCEKIVRSSTSRYDFYKSRPKGKICLLRDWRNKLGRPLFSVN